jgi:tetratricopeptide (TPR) repeat protein
MPISANFAVRILPHPTTVICICIIGAIFVGLETCPAWAKVDQKRYSECIAKIDSSPKDAFDSAAFWRFSGGGIAAAHCAGLALIRMGQHKYGAESLENVVRKMGDSDEFNEASKMAEVLAQAGHGWILAGDPARAQRMFTKALEFQPGTATFFIDRSIAAIDLRDFRSAASDLDAAVKFDPEIPRAFAFRARVRRKLSNVEGAVEDANRALALNPNHVLALLERGLLRRMLKDAKGARLDWRQVIGIAPESTEAAAAKAMIKALDAD